MLLKSSVLAEFVASAGLLIALCGYHSVYAAFPAVIRHITVFVDPSLMWEITWISQAEAHRDNTPGHRSWDAFSCGRDKYFS